MSWAIILDLVITIMLGVTIFYAWKLSIYLKTFRDSRRDLNNLLQDLSSSVARAENAIQGMQNSAAEAGYDLQDIIKEAKFLADELKFMNEAGDSLAGRLEKLADRNRTLIDSMEEVGGLGHTQSQLAFHERETRQKAVRPVPRQESVRQEESFHIQDREYENEFEYEEDYAEDHYEDDYAAIPDRPYQDPVPSEPLRSKAEQDLYEALRRRTQAIRRKGRGS